MTYRFPIFDGDRVALAPHLDLWMAGVRFGTVIAVQANEEGTRMYCVDYGDGVSDRTVWLTAEDLLGAVNSRPGGGGIDQSRVG